MTLQSIDHHQIADLCRGSVFLATGGGGDPYVCQLLAEQALKTFGAVELTPLEQVPDDAVVVSLGEVGAPTVSLEQLPVGDEVIRVLERYEAYTGRQTTHIVCFEVGGANSVVPLIAASARHMPVIDGDGMARALPEAQMMTFAIEGISPTPAVGLDYRGNTVMLETDDPLLYELQIRGLAMAMGGMIFTAEHGMSGTEARRATVPGTLSFAIEVGQLLAAHRGHADAMLPHLIQLFAASIYGEVRHLYTGKVTDLSKRVVHGYDVGEARLEPFDGQGEAMRIAIKNEYLLATVGERVVASVPDLICMVDHETSTPINSERLRYGQRVTVIGIGCPPHFRTPKALAVVAPRCFGFDLDYVPIEDL